MLRRLAIAMLVMAGATSCRDEVGAQAAPSLDFAPPAHYTLDDVQGCWWVVCGQPHAEFCVRGDAVEGDFASPGTVVVAGERMLVLFNDGPQLERRILAARKDRLVLDGDIGRVPYRTCP